MTYELYKQTLIDEYSRHPRRLLTCAEAQRIIPLDYSSVKQMLAVLEKEKKVNFAQQTYGYANQLGPIVLNPKDLNAPQLPIDMNADKLEIVQNAKQVEPAEIIEQIKGDWKQSTELKLSNAVIARFSK